MATSPAQPKFPATACVELRGLSKTYSSGAKSVAILQGLSLHVPEKSLSVIIGRSGSGKSTLLNLIAGLDKPDEGEVILSGTALNGLSQEELAAFRLRHVGLVFQFFNLLPTLTLGENVLLPAYLAGASRKAALEKAEHYLEKVGIRHLAHQLPNQASGGEIQRAAVARALINRPRLILADEPTGNLDEETGRELLGLFLELSRKEDVSLLIVTHDEKLITGADHRYVLEHGKIRAGEAART